MNFKLYLTLGRNQKTKFITNHSSLITIKMLHALLIGINEYAPGSGVRNLSGCVNDVNAVKAFLEKHYANLQPNIRTVLNEQATREGVIKAFREHLTGPQIKAGDQVLFYYSGHGSFGPTAPEFAYNNPSKQDETMVCYDSRVRGKQDLADKERGALLAEIPKHAQVTLIIDSCHAASSFRNNQQDVELGGTRFQPGQTSPRSLDSYMIAEGENIFLQQKEKGEKIAVPQRSYVLLAACKEEELARETKDNRGLFTKYLLEVWENSGMDYTCEELLQRVHFLVQALNEKQNPVLETVQVSPKQVLLSETVRPNQVHNLAKYKNGSWQVNCGAIHGMPTDPEKLKLVKVGLHDSNKPPGKKPTMVKGVKQVFATYSLLDLDLPERDFFWASVDFAISLPVAISGDARGLEGIQNFRSIVAIPKYWIEAAPADIPKYELSFENGMGNILLHGNAQHLYGPDSDLENINTNLNQIIRWEQLRELANPNSSIASKLEVEFCEEPKDNSAPIPFKVHRLSFMLGKTSQGETDTLWYHLRARNTSSQPLHVALLYLSPNYGIEVHYMRRILPPRSEWVKLDETSRELGLFDKNSAIERFLVLYSTEAFEEFQYEQSELGGKDTGRDLVPRSLASNDWATQLFEIELRS